MMGEEFYSGTIDELEMFIKIKEQQKEINRLNKECDTYMKIATKRGNIIDKAIEYINKTVRVDNEYTDYMEMEICEYKELLNMLKGE